MSDRPNTPIDDDDAMAKVIRLAGRRPVAAEDARERVYAAVHERWQESLSATRRTQRTMSWLAAAAALVAVAVGITLLRTPGGVANAEVATLQTARGTLWVARAGSQNWQAASELGDGSLRAGDALRTAAGDGRAVIGLASGASLRLNADTEIVLSAVDRIALAHGVIYLDSGAKAHGSITHLHTALGDVWDVGTQFELRADADSLRIRVREGAVQFQGDDRSMHSEAGDDLLIPARGNSVRTRIDPYDDAWAWVSDLASFRAEGDYTAATLLEWVSRETGRTLRFDAPATQMHAGTLLLHGAEGLSPQDTLEVVSATTDLRYDLESDAILISAAQH